MASWSAIARNAQLGGAPKWSKYSKKKNRRRKGKKSEAKPFDFYRSDAWRKVRYHALKKNDGKCELCGSGKKDGVVLHVDHIKPRSIHPELALTVSNLQILCEDCNLGKSNCDDTDWRSPPLNDARIK